MTFTADEVEVGDIVSTEDGPDTVREITVTTAEADGPIDYDTYHFVFTSGKIADYPSWEYVRVFEGY